MDKNYAEYLSEETKKDYNLIAERFSSSRNIVPEDLKLLADYTKKKEKILDMGCGNGFLYDVLKEKDADYVGIDSSENLMAFAKKRNPLATFRKADALNLPFADNYFDKVYSIGVLHQIPSKEFRLRFLKEAKRVLKPEGLLILRVWNLWKREKGLKLILRYTFLKIIGRSKLDFKDIFVPWKDNKGGILTNRYYHCFTKGELEKLAKKAGFKIEKSWSSGEGMRANIYLIAQNH